MLSFNLNSKKSAEDLIKLCEKYRDDVEVEVIHGNQTVNGGSRGHTRESDRERMQLTRRIFSDWELRGNQYI